VKPRLHLVRLRTVEPTNERAYRRAWELLFAQEASNTPGEPSLASDDTPQVKDDESGLIPPGQHGRSS